MAGMTERTRGRGRRRPRRRMRKPQWGKGEVEEGGGELHVVACRSQGVLEVGEPAEPTRGPMERVAFLRLGIGLCLQIKPDTTTKKSLKHPPPPKKYNRSPTDSPLGEQGEREEERERERERKT
eukprot:8876407-Pyramimonas_sp.AAC.2